MKDNTFNNILCSIESKDFYLVYDGLGTYNLYYENDLVLEIVEEKTIEQLYKENNFYTPYTKFKEKCENELLNRVIQELIEVFGDAPKTQSKIMYTLQNLIISLKDAEKEKQINADNIRNATTTIIEKIRELTTIAGYETTIFDNLTNADNIDAEIQQRANPLLTNDEKAKADAIAKEINKIGLLPYLDNILKDIHIGEHKNIYRKILMLFKIMRGEASFLSETTAKAEAGKSFEDEIVFNMIAPQRYIFKLNEVTSASFKRYGALNPYYFDRQIILFGDLGSENAFKQIKDVFNIFKVLITEKEYYYSKADKNDEFKTIEFDLKVNSIGAVYSTIENSFTKNDNQLESRTLFSTPSNVDVKDIMKQLFYLENPNTKQSKARVKAEEKLKDFGLYLMQMVNSDIEIINPYEDVFLNYALNSENPIREVNQQLELFNAYCILTQSKCENEVKGTLFASMEQLKEYMDYINLENALIPYEFDFLNMIMAKDKSNELTILYNENDFYDVNGVQLNYNYLKDIKNGEKVYNADGELLNIDLNNITTLRECENYAIELLNNENIETYADLNQIDLKNLPFKLNTGYGLRTSGANHIKKIFFKYSDLKAIYYRYTAFKNVENVPRLLQTLYNKGYLGKYEYKIDKENLYYLTPLCLSLETKFNPKKSYDEYVNEYFINAGYENF